MVTSTTTDPASNSEVEITDRCSEPPETVVALTLNDARGDQLASACLRSPAVQHLGALRGESFGFEVEPTGTKFENPQQGVSGVTISAALDFFNDSGSFRRVIQRWTFVDTDAGLIVDTVEDVPTEEVVTDGEAAVRDYLAHLASGRYDEAAGLLGEGGLDWDERFDITALPNESQTTAELAEALRQWCMNGALCTDPTSTSGRPTIRGGSAEVTATWGSGDDPATATIVGRTYEGVPAVTGLPPLVDGKSLPILVSASGARVAVVRMSDGRVLAWRDGTISEMPVVPDSSAWSDGAFVYWQVFENRESGPSGTTSVVSDLDGNIVCEAPGSIYTVRRLSDGVHVASVERETEPTTTGVEYPIPNFAVDCASGKSQPIEPRTYRREGGSRSTTQIGGRSFVFDYDAEGNADVMNDAGLTINGDDYAGFHTFSPDASRVVYGDYGVSVSPHVTTTIRTRDTSTGDLLWSFVLPRVFGTLSFTDGQVLVGLPPDHAEQDPWRLTESIVALDATSGLQVASIPTTIEIIHLS